MFKISGNACFPLCSVYAVVLLLWFTVDHCAMANTSKLIEHTNDSFVNVEPGKISFVYFGNHVDPSIEMFLRQLELSADALEDYGISVAKVNCSSEYIENYCSGKLMKRAYLFRGSEALRSFDIATVFDVNAIVSHVLFTVLFNEVRYVHTQTELLNIERTVKGKRDIVFGHIQVLGLPEHRALMETAFVYGTKYQFALTMGGPVLKQMGFQYPSSTQAQLWLLHCKGAPRQSVHCPHTLLRRPLTTVNIHTFLQLMELPPISETAVDPTEAEVIYSRLNVPVLFLFSQAQTQAMDRTTAETLAWTLRGEVGVVLVNRDSPDVKTPMKYNAAYRLPEEGASVTYLTLKSVQEAVSLIRGDLLNVENQEEEEDEDHWAVHDALDDEVAESVYRDRDVLLDLEPIAELNADTFNTAVAQNGLTAVLFYVKWDAVSMAFMESYLEVSDALEDMPGVQLASVDCGEWTDICTHQQISSFPTVQIYRPEQDPQTYRGMLGTESLRRFLLLSQVASPLSLVSSAEVLSFTEGELYSRHSALSPIRVVGLFRSSQDPGVAVFEEAARALRGEILLGLFVNEHAEKWAEEHSLSLPAALVTRGPGVQRKARSVSLSSPTELVTLIQHAALLMDLFPELTVENLPWYLEHGKPLLLLFVGEEESAETTMVLGEIRDLVETGQLDPYLPCWIHLGRTPAGGSVIEAYLGMVPPLPALVLSQLTTGGEVFQFPPEQPLRSGDILQWLERVERGQEQSAGVVAKEKWRPTVPFYNFLAIMDKEVPGYAAQRSPRMKTGARGLQAGESQSSSDERAASDPPVNPPAPHQQHSEL